jgi:hypothetical protein
MDKIKVSDLLEILKNLPINRPEFGDRRKYEYPIAPPFRFNPIEKDLPEKPIVFKTIIIEWSDQEMEWLIYV